MDNAAREIAALRQPPQLLCDPGCRPGVDPLASEYLPGRRRGAAEGLWRGRGELGGGGAARDQDRSGFDTKNMGDGWETRRRRGPGHDWAIVKLGTPGRIERIEIDTNHFKGNYPDSASIEGCFAPGGRIDDLASAAWRTLLPQTKLKAHHRHLFSRELRPIGAVSHVRLNIYPDGGVSRLRVYGTVGTD